MRKLKLQMQMTLDGFVAGRNGEMDMLTFNWDDQINKYVTEITAPVDCMVLGRKLAEGFIPYWINAVKDPVTADAARKIVSAEKIVFSRTIASSPWENARIANGDLREEIKKLKASEGGDIIAYGGGEFVSNLIESGLIDEYHLLIDPVAIGDGMSVFQKLTARLNLKLISAQAFECGIAALAFTSRRDG